MHQKPFSLERGEISRKVKMRRLNEVNMRRVIVKMLTFVSGILDGSGRCCRNGFAKEVLWNEVNLRRLFII